MEVLEIFLQKLQQAKEDWTAIQAIFSNHFASRFTHDFVMRELRAVGNDPGYVVPNSVGPANFTFVKTAEFEYSVRILAPFPARSHFVKWLGMRQIVGIRGAGPVTIRNLKVPLHLNIASFQPGVLLDEYDLITMTDQDIIATQTKHQSLDICDVSSPVIAEFLTYRREDSGMLWNFDQDLRSCYPEQSSLTVSRFRNVLELAHAAGKPVPDYIYDLALDPSRPHLALLAIRSMLMSGHADAFVHLQRAMDSGCQDLSKGAQRILDSMTMLRGSIHAT